MVSEINSLCKSHRISHTDTLTPNLIKKSIPIHKHSHCSQVTNLDSNLIHSLFGIYASGT